MYNYQQNKLLYLNELFTMSYQKDLLGIGFRVNQSYYCCLQFFFLLCLYFLATPNRGSAYRCLQTKNWRDPTLRSIAERSSLPLHRYLPTIFTIWIGKTSFFSDTLPLEIRYFEWCE